MNSRVLRYSELWDAFFNQAPFGVAVLGAMRDEDDRIFDFEVLAANSRAFELTGTCERDALGLALGQAYPAFRQIGLLARLARAVDSGEGLELEQVVPGPPGSREEPTWYGLTVVPAGERVIVTFSSITKRKAVLLEAVKLMNHDDLTGVGNRRLLKSHFWMKRQQNVPVGVLYFDLNGFKAINDTYGHEMGDEVLRVVAQRLKKNVRPSEVAARLGGDEFAVLLDSGDPAAVAMIAERLAAAVSERIQLGEASVTVNAAVGAAVYPHDGTSFEALLSAADGKMYVDKRSG